MRLYDTHAHLDDEQFEGVRAQVLERAAAAGLERVLSVGTTAESSVKTVELARRHDLVRAAVGIQPNYVAQARPGDWDRVARLAEDPHVAAIGETGLDKYWDYAPFDLQRDYFDRHLRLAQLLDLPFVVHMRDSGEEIAEMLQEARARGPLRGVMHSFTGDAELASCCLELGLHVSFAGMVTYKKSDQLRAVAAAIPEDRLLVETDAPYLSPHPRRGTRPNEPAMVRHTVECLAEVRGVSAERLAERTAENARQLLEPPRVA